MADFNEKADLAHVDQGADQYELTKEEKDVGGHGRQGSRQQSVSLNRNVTARIQNPLAGIPRDTLFYNVEQFAQDANMQDMIPLLKKGALVAQDPPAFEQIPELDEVERDALRNEVLHKWRQPTALYFTVILCSIGAAVQG